MTEITILPLINAEQAQQLTAAVDSLLESIGRHEHKLSASYAKLGILLSDVESTQAWAPLGFAKFSSYLEDIRKRIDRKRSQIYNYIAVAKALSPYLSEFCLEEIGITKGNELRRLVLERGCDPWSVYI